MYDLCPACLVDATLLTEYFHYQVLRRTASALNSKKVEGKEAGENGASGLVSWFTIVLFY